LCSTYPDHRERRAAVRVTLQQATETAWRVSGGGARQGIYFSTVLDAVTGWCNG
jgi:hypothetical protein